MNILKQSKAKMAIACLLFVASFLSSVFAVRLALNNQPEFFPAKFYFQTIVGCFCAFFAFKLIKKPNGDGSNVNISCEVKRDKNKWRCVVNRSASHHLGRIKDD